MSTYRERVKKLYIYEIDTMLNHPFKFIFGWVLSITISYLLCSLILSSVSLAATTFGAMLYPFLAALFSNE